MGSLYHGVSRFSRLLPAPGAAGAGLAHEEAEALVGDDVDPRQRRAPRGVSRMTYSLPSGVKPP